MEYRYCGSERQPPRVSGHETPLALENARSIIQKAWATGRIHVSTHIKRRFSERNVDMIDLENVVRTGKVTGREHCPHYRNWKYRMAGLSDERTLEVIFALDFAEDFADSPLVVPVTVLVKDVPSVANSGEGETK
jgi:hypothetical protein